MKSGRQRRSEIQARRTGKRAAIRAEDERAEAKKRAVELRAKVLVNPANLRPTNSYGIPDFVACRGHRNRAIFPESGIQINHRFGGPYGIA